MAVPQYIEKFTSYDGSTTTYTFDLKQGASTRSQSLRTPIATAIGADWAHDFNGVGQAARDPETLTMTWLIVRSTAALVDAEIDLCRSTLLTIGKGRIYALFADGSRRWAYARLTAMPTFSRAPGQLTYVPMSASFLRLSNWYATSATTASQTITGYQTMVTITNAGNVYVRDLVLTFDALAAAGFASPSVQNLTTGDSVSTTRIADTDSSEWQINGSDQAVYYSHDSGFYVGGGSVGDSGIGGGTVLADDYALVTRGATQNGLISLKPGANQLVIQCAGTPNFTFSSSFTAQYA
jgi:hypothetical protein